MYYIYILHCGDDSLYTGIARYLNRRMHQHVEQPTTSARYTKYTRSRGVKSLAALWRTETRSDAARLEAKIKSLSRPEKLALIAAPATLSEPYTPLPDVTLEDCLTGRFSDAAPKEDNS